MNEYALFMNGEFVKIKKFTERPPHIPHKNVVWYPVVRETVDNSTQQYTETIKTQTIENDTYVIRRTIQDLPQAEIDTIIESEKTENINLIDRNYTITRALALTLFEVVNQVRVLNGQVEITPDQFKTYLKSKL